MNQKKSARTRRPASPGPVFVCRHRLLKAVVWQNLAEKNTPEFVVTVTRSHKEVGIWRETTGLGFDDVLIVAELLRACYGFMSAAMRSSGTDGGPSS